MEERKKLVDKFLKNRGILKKRQIYRRVAKQDLPRGYSKANTKTSVNGD